MSTRSPSFRSNPSRVAPQKRSAFTRSIRALSLAELRRLKNTRLPKWKLESIAAELSRRRKKPALKKPTRSEAEREAREAIARTFAPKVPRAPAPVRPPVTVPPGTPARERKRLRELADIAAQRAIVDARIRALTAELARAEQEARRLDERASRRREAARRGAATRRENKRRNKAALDRRTVAEREHLERRGSEPPPLRFKRYFDTVHIGVSEFNAASLVKLWRLLRMLGVIEVRFLRQVPVARGSDTMHTPTGVASTHWLATYKMDDDRIAQEVGKMMVPGVNYVTQLIFRYDDVRFLPKYMQKQIEEAPVFGRGDEIIEWQ